MRDYCSCDSRKKEKRLGKENDVQLTIGLIPMTISRKVIESVDLCSTQDEKTSKIIQTTHILLYSKTKSMLPREAYHKLIPNIGFKSP